MSQKKLVLSALPEQTDDYSRYEESVTRWDRIIAVGVILVLVIAILIYALTVNNDISSEDNVQKGSTLIETVPAKTVDEAVQLDTSSSVIPDHQDSNITINALDADKPKLIEKNIEQDLSKAVSKDVVVEELSLVKPKTVQVDTQAPKLSILNNAITHAVLTLDLNDKVSVTSIPYKLVLPEEGIVKVMLLTEMNGLRGKKLFHEWYRNGVRQARVKIPVNINKQRSYSSKYINEQMLGDWQVKVVDEKADTYVLASFNVVLP